MRLTSQSRMHGNYVMPYRCMSAARAGLAEPAGPDLARRDQPRARVGNRPRQSANGRDRMGTQSATAVAYQLSFSRRTTARASSASDARHDEGEFDSARRHTERSRRRTFGRSLIERSAGTTPGGFLGVVLCAAGAPNRERARGLRRGRAQVPAIGRYWIIRTAVNRRGRRAFASSGRAGGIENRVGTLT